MLHVIAKYLEIYLSSALITQGLVGKSDLHQVLVAHLPAKTEEHLQALQSTAVEVAAGPKPSTIDYIKLMTPVSHKNTLISLSLFIHPTVHTVVTDMHKKLEGLTISFNLQDSDGRPSDFVALLLRQYQQEIQHFTGEISQALADKRYYCNVIPTHTCIIIHLKSIIIL